jgi:hypothetical protein
MSWLEFALLLPLSKHYLKLASSISDPSTHLQYANTFIF